MVSRRTRVASWIFRRDHPSRPKAMICCFFSSFKTFAMLREATYPPAAVNVLDVSSASMAAFQVVMYGRFWVFTEAQIGDAESPDDKALRRKPWPTSELHCPISRTTEDPRSNEITRLPYRRKEIPVRRQR